MLYDRVQILKNTKSWNIGAQLVFLIENLRLGIVNIGIGGYFRGKRRIRLHFVYREVADRSSWLCYNLLVLPNPFRQIQRPQ